MKIFGTLLACFCTLLLGNSQARADSTTPIPGAPLASFTDSNGVDLISGDIIYSRTDVYVGSADSGLAAVATGYSTDNFTGAIYNLHAYMGALYNRTPNLYYYSLSYGNSSQKFSGSSGTFSTIAGEGQSLTCGPSECIYTLKDGTVVRYTVTSTINGVVTKAVMSSITKPDGEVITITYPSGQMAEDHKLSVSSSLGWMLKYGSTLTAINTSVDYCDPNASVCSGTSVSWPHVTYGGGYNPSYTGGVTTVTDALNGVTTVGSTLSYSPCNSNNYPCLTAEDCYPSQYNLCPNIGPPMSPFFPAHKIALIKSPLGVQKTISYGLDPYIVYTGDDGRVPDGGDPHWVGSVTTGTGSWNYGFATHSTDSTVPELYQRVVVTDPGGGIRTLFYGLSTYYPGPDNDTNQLSRKTTYQYTAVPGLGYKISIMAYPEATWSGSTPVSGYTKYSYDSRGNVTEVRDVAKAGSGLADRVVSAGYDVTCTNPKTCNRPNWVKDAKANQTDFTYAPEHGGILTETLPADSNGIRPQKRYYYSQLYPKVKNSSGALVNSSPAWRLTRTETCASSTNSCSGTSDETVTLYEYNHNNLLLTAKTVMAGNANLSLPPSTTNLWEKTSYSYDPIGNVIAIDGAKTDVDDTTYISYDALRRRIFEIGPDPDGGGPLKRLITHHVYDADSNEIRTEFGTGSATDGSDFVITKFIRQTFDPATGYPVKKEVVQP